VTKLAEHLAVRMAYSMAERSVQQWVERLDIVLVVENLAV
jgi:hypothetical protein